MADVNSPFKANVIAGRVVLVTGGGSGIGFGIAKTLGDHGAKVVIMGRREQFLQDACAKLEQRGIETAYYAGDVRKEEDAKGVVDLAVSKFGRLGTLVNSAAGNFLAPAEEMSLNAFRTVLEIDLFGVFNMCRCAFPALKESGNGVIINISATLHYSATWYQTHATAAKSAIDSVTRQLALEWGTYGIRVNGIAPGPIADTPGLTKLSGGRNENEKIAAGIPIGRVGTTQDIGLTSLFLCTEAASFISGDIVVRLGKEAKKAKKAKKAKRKPSSSSLADELLQSEDEHKGKAAKGPGGSKRILLVLVALAVVFALWKATSGGGGGGDNAQAAAAEAASKSKSSKKKKSKAGDDEEGGENDDESLSMEGVDVIESKHGKLGWDKLQGPLVTKRPPRECSIRRIAPQVREPFFLLNKKTKWKRRIYTCLRQNKKACPKAIMDDFLARRWKLKPHDKSLEDRVMSTFVLTDSNTLVKLKAGRPQAFHAIYTLHEGSTYLNALMGASGLDGSILEQYVARSKLAKNFGCSYNALKIQPPQFQYDASSDCTKLEKALARHSSDSWVLSEWDPETGEEKLTLKSSQQLQAEKDFCAKNVRVSSTRDSTRLASMVVANPFTGFDNKLFDVRSYILIGSTMPMMVFFRQGFVRTASGSGFRSPYQFDQDAQEVSLDVFQEYLAREKLTGSHYVDTFLQSSMKQVALFLFHATRTKIHRRRGSYQIFSVDFVIDKTFRVYLEKTSGNPAMETHNRVDLDGLIADMHDLVQELHEVPVAFEGMVKGDKYGGWELIFSELSESCDKIVYNPCHTFIDFNDKDLTKQNKKVGKVQQTAKRLDNERKRIVKKTEEKKKNLCRERKIPYPGNKCDKFFKDLEQEDFNKRFALHEKSFNPNDFRLPKPGEVFAHEIVE
ncbi:Peroxisomal 2,4-dienoyl-CoA reductase [Hondaea fermentalgiana]|uniref:2,4-dienoyl-CoA reductase [(3E)-enoyl-CoA-producing] n=1 Tax=Hondaea fermentalgiana TaxID=2315210 RepID=A0A2R5H1E4_9STRA|nr:Peroxisomal 2,4-dienoyl-CoA reductase [Hondaea fermentalgiana]|eukprot:GBG34621.1 Peroxisomal 2,4-dienoyl-CoA reductase [Hondaea fermentalgiana]